MFLGRQKGQPGLVRWDNQGPLPIRDAPRLHFLLASDPIDS
jgi:hypothetical protein